MGSKVSSVVGHDHVVHVSGQIINIRVIVAVRRGFWKGLYADTWMQASRMSGWRKYFPWLRKDENLGERIRRNLYLAKKAVSAFD